METLTAKELRLITEQNIGKQKSVEIQCEWDKTMIMLQHNAAKGLNNYEIKIMYSENVKRLTDLGYIVQENLDVQYYFMVNW